MKTRVEPVTPPYAPEVQAVFDKRALIEYAPDVDRLHLLTVLSGDGELAGMPSAGGQCWRVPAGGEVFAIAPGAKTEMLGTWVP